MPSTSCSDNASLIRHSPLWDPPSGVAPLDGGVEAVLLGVVLEPAPFRRVAGDAVEQGGEQLCALQAHVVVRLVDHELLHDELVDGHAGHQPARQDRKSTRLNSSHANISYAVFCLKKKKTTHSDQTTLLKTNTTTT